LKSKSTSLCSSRGQVADVDHDREPVGGRFRKRKGPPPASTGFIVAIAKLKVGSSWVALPTVMVRSCSPRETRSMT
jgi:hypothetical protein